MQQEKICPKCNELKTAEDFGESTKRSDGLQIHCRSCRKAYNKERYLKDKSFRDKVADRRNRVRNKALTLVSRYKRFCGCKICGEKEPIALDLHHLDPSVKEDNPSSMIGGSIERLKAEVRKCVVLCANCHRKVHAGILEI